MLELFPQIEMFSPFATYSMEERRCKVKKRTVLKQPLQVNEMYNFLPERIEQKTVPLEIYFEPRVL